MLGMAVGRFAEKLSQARAAKDWSKYRLAKETGFSEAYIGQLESGKGSPSPEALGRLSQALEVPLDELQAWADADRLGDEGLARLKRYVLDFPEDQLPEGGLDLTESEMDDIAQVVRRWPKARQDVFVRRLSEAFVRKTGGRG